MGILSFAKYDDENGCYVDNNWQPRALAAGLAVSLVPLTNCVVFTAVSGRCSRAAVVLFSVSRYLPWRDQP